MNLTLAGFIGLATLMLAIAGLVARLVSKGNDVRNELTNLQTRFDEHLDRYHRR